MAAIVAGADFGDSIHYVHAIGYLAEYRIAPTLRSFAAKIQKRIIGVVNEELRRGRMWIAGACHSQRASIILQAVVGFVLYRRTFVGFIFHVGRDTATLDHEIWYHAVENSIDEVPVIDIS